MRKLKLVALWLILQALPLPLHAGGLGSGVHALRAALPAPLPEEGLVILKHREGAAFDLEDFLANPERYAEDFLPLTRAEDQDSWTVHENKGRVVTHLDREDLFLVAAGPGFTLDVEWGDVPLAKFFERHLAAEADAEGCYSSLRTGLRNRDGSAVRAPFRLFYCPADSAVLFDAPDGYEIGLTALRDEQRVERTEASPLVSDNLRLYVRQVYPRSPSSRASGGVLANTLAGLRDAAYDLRDAFGHAVTGTRPLNIHTGQEIYRPSPLTAAPLFVWHLFHLEPSRGLASLFAGPASGMQVAADGVSATSNAVLNPVVQVSVGSISTPAADTTGDLFGAVLQALAKNLPLAERSIDAFNPLTFVQHDRAFQPTTYTRTDTQLNLDRSAALIDVHLISSYRARRDDDSSRRNDSSRSKDSDGGSPQGSENGSSGNGNGSGSITGGDVPPANGGGNVPPLPPTTGGDLPPLPPTTGGDLPPLPPTTGGDLPPLPPTTGGDLPPLPPTTGGDLPPLPPTTGGDLPPLPPTTGGDLPPLPPTTGGDLPPLPPTTGGDLPPLPPTTGGD